MLKLWLRRIHLTLAILTVFFLVNLSISGALLVFGKEIQHQARPPLWLVKPGTAHLPLSQLLAKAETFSGNTVKQIRLQPQADLAWQFQLNNGQYLSVNPFNGNILHRYDDHDSFYGFVMAWHRWLLLTGEAGGKPLKVLLSITSLLFIIEMILGLWLWIKPRNRLKRLKINLKAKPRVKYYQLHTVIGVFTAVPLLLIAFSGMAFHWQSQTKAVVEALIGESVAQYQHPVIAADTEAKLRLDLALSQGMKAMGQGQLYRIYLPEQDQPLKLRVKMPGEFFAFSWLWVNPYTGQVIKTYDASEANLATRIWNFKYKFHTGDFAGMALRAVWILLALLPGAFAITGIWLCIKRTRKKSQAHDPSIFFINYMFVYFWQDGKLNA